MKKIYVIIGKHENIRMISSAVTSKKVAETLCKYKNLCEKEDNSNWRYCYQSVKIHWNSTDIQWLEDKITELKMKELPF